MHGVYWELLEYIHTRYAPFRQDDPSKRQLVISAEQFQCMEEGVKRLPSELERRFFDILYLIVADWWRVPDAE